MAGISAALLGLLVLFVPRSAGANWPFTSAQAAEGDTVPLQDPNLALLEAAVNPDPNPIKGGTPLTVSEGSALIAEGSAGESASAEEDDSFDDASVEKPVAEKKPAAKAAPKIAPKAKAAPKPKAAAKSAKLPAISGYFGNPCPSCRLSQGLHGNNAVDLSAPAGTPIYAAAAGTVTTVKDDNGWNSGWGNYVVVSHGNGTSTLYAHMSSVATNSGSSVGKGSVIGYVGRTGEATGNHVHFEVHGAKNPFAQ